MLKNGDIFDNHTVISHLGDGGFGHVYRAHKGDPQDLVALKVCRLGTGQIDQDRFVQENKILHFLYPHKNIISPLGDAITYNGHLYYAMELADNNLEDYLAINDSNLNFSERIRIFKEICDGLAHVHEKNIIHRDLHQNNVLVKRVVDSDTAKINDFGKAKDFNSNFVVSPNGIDWGIIYVRPPELIFNIWDSTDFENYVSADMFALGIILYFIIMGSAANFHVELQGDINTFLRSKSLTLKLLWALETTKRESIYKEWLSGLRNNQFKALNITLSDPSNDVVINDIISRLCNPDNSRRYQSVRALITDIDRLNI